MNVVVKNDVIWIRPVPTTTVVKGIHLFVPKLETNINSGIIYRDIIKGQGDYQLPPGTTANDVADIKVSSGVLMIDFN